MYSSMVLVALVLLSPTFAVSIINAQYGARYQPNWDSLDARPLPTWYDEAKIGIFIHWGVFSVPSFGSEWFWYDWKEYKSEPFVNFMKQNYPQNFSYQEFAKDFTAEFFNASQWADLFQQSGARYVVLTSKHHEGFTLWPSKYSYSWNSMDVGPHRDIVGELAWAVRERGLTFGTYHSLYEWFHPLYLADKANNFTTQDFVLNKIIPEMRELVEKYEVSVLWSDGDWEADDTYWNSTEFLAWLYSDSPVKDDVVVNDRWGKGIPCHHGDFYSCKDRYNPGTLQPHKWENAMTIDKTSWGFRRNAIVTDYMTISDLLYQLVTTVSCGGNLLMNIGPTSYGTIPPIFQERLLQMGEWLSINGDAIYASKPWTVQNDTITPGVWYTSYGKIIYAIVLEWNDIVVLNPVLSVFRNNNPLVTLLGNENTPLHWRIDTSTVDGVYITLPSRTTVRSQWAWVLKINPQVTSISDNIL